MKSNHKTNKAKQSKLDIMNPVTLAGLRKWSQEDQESKAIFGYIETKVQPGL